MQGHDQRRLSAPRVGLRCIKLLKLNQEAAGGGGSQRVVDIIAAILRAEGVDTLSCYPTTPMIDAASDAGIRPVLCRQERVGVGIADGYARVSGSRSFGVFAMQYGPGAENAYPGIASAHSDGVPILLLPMGNALDRAQTRPLFSATKSYASITKSVETITRPEFVVAILRRAISSLKNGVPGPVMVEIPVDIGQQAVSENGESYQPIVVARSQGAPDDIDRAMSALLAAERPIIYAGQGVLRSGASAELTTFAELLGVPVVTSLGGKSSISEDHPLSLGAATVVASDVVVEFVRQADLVFAIGASLTRHFLSLQVPTAAQIIHATLNPDDLNKGRYAEYAIVGDARLVLTQLIEAAHQHDITGRSENSRAVAHRITSLRTAWLAGWQKHLMSDDVPITPYRVIHEFGEWADRAHTIVTHDSGSPRDQIVPFYNAVSPRTYLGWGKSHALGSGLGLIMGAKLAAPDNLAVYFLGDSAFGMTGLDLETAARNAIPIVSIVLNNGTMAIETTSLISSHEKHRSRDIGGDYAAIAEALGVPARRVTRPSALVPAFEWAKSVTLGGRPALLEVITSAETRFSNRRVVSVPHW